MSSGYLLLKNNQEGNEASRAQQSDVNTSFFSSFQTHNLGIWDGIALAFMLLMTIVVVKKLYKSFTCGDKEGCSCDTHSKKQP